MNIRKRMVGPVTVISLDGQLDSHTTPEVQAKISRLLPAHGRVLLDFGKVACLSGDGLRTALLLYRQAQCLDSSVALVGLSPSLRNVLAATGYLDFFVVAETVADAIAALQSQAPGYEEQEDEQPALRA